MTNGIYDTHRQRPAKKSIGKRGLARLYLKANSDASILSANDDHPFLRSTKEPSGIHLTVPNIAPRCGVNSISRQIVKHRAPQV
jgi:hypothetical protein